MNKIRAIGAALLLVASLAIPGTSALAVTEHCPDGGTKTEATADELNDIVLPAGTSFCVKGSTDATGILVADGETTLEAYLGNGHDVSYYVVYSTPEVTPSPEPTPTPDVTPTPTPTAPPTPTPEPTPTVTPEPSVTPTPTITDTPVPTDTPTGTPILPQTDTEPTTTHRDGPVALVLLFLVAIAALFALKFRPTRRV